MTANAADYASYLKSHLGENWTKSGTRIPPIHGPNTRHCVRCGRLQPHLCQIRLESALSLSHPWSCRGYIRVGVGQLEGDAGLKKKSLQQKHTKPQLLAWVPAGWPCGR